MSILNFKIYRGVLTLCFFSFVFVACGGVTGSATSYKPVGTATPGSSNTPTVSLSATSISIAYQASSVVSWISTNSTSCTSSGGGGTDTEGSFNTGTLSHTTSYIVTCVGASGSAKGRITITVAPSVITKFSSTTSGVVTVTSANDLSNGAIISISGTTNYNGSLYTVSNVTPTKFDIVHSYVGDDATGIWQMAGGMISGCSDVATKGSLAAISLSNVPHRFNGVAPLSVFFDASDTTATSTTTPFHDLQYRWDFGDTGAGMWAYGARPGTSSKNSESGALAAHVFESPGVYTVALSVTDGANTVSSSCAQIVVQHPDAVFSGTDTVCVSTGTDFTDCPAGATTHTTSSYNTAIGYIGSGVHRLLFKAGDTWTGASAASVSTAGPGLIGSFGSGAKPIIRGGAVGGSFLLVQANDWRVVGLDFDGNMTNPSSGGINLVDTNTTILNMHIHRLSWGVFGGSGSAYDVVQEVVMDDIDPASTNAAAVYWTPSTTSALLGNYINPTGYGDHVIRMGAATKFVIAHNTLGKPGAGNGHAIKLHQTSSPQNVWNGTYTEKVIIADNHVLPTTTSWQIVVAPQNNLYPEHVRDVIVERNWMEAGAANVQISMSPINEDNLHPSTVRNNILDMSTSNTGITGVVVMTSTPGIVTNGVRVHNNTCYSSVAANFRCIQIGEATNTRVFNNLASAPNGSKQKTMLIDGGKGTLQASNLLNNTPSALFVNAAPSLPDHFVLKSGTNPAADTGTNVPVYDDFLGADTVMNARPNGSALDLGAYER